MWQRLARVFRREPAAPSLAKILAKRNADRLLVYWCEDRSDAIEAWRAVPRIDWAVEAAVRLGVERALVQEGLDALEQAEELAALAAGYAASKIQPEALLEACVPRLLSIVEQHPDVAKAREVLKSASWSTAPRLAAQIAADRYDAAHALAHRELAARFRSRIHDDAVRYAIEGPRSHPYR
ncbi:hypothetical protein GPROT1_02995 [Gammaproteobacteria bacterium]|nr:hypothetical protein GPROT1_02995 [Gammaproteobacteria bacterium]